MGRRGPEAKIEAELRKFLHVRGWLTEKMQGNAYQIGIPDLLLGHPRFGSRWVDVKNPDDYSFTKAQRIKWPRWERYGLGVWILTAASESEYDKLFKPPNWRAYWKESWAMPTTAELDAMLDAIELEQTLPPQKVDDGWDQGE